MPLIKTNFHCVLTVLTYLAMTLCVQADELSFSRDVRPILSEMCFSCHGPDEKGRKGELLLSEMDGALKGGESGEPAIVPGKPALSEMIKRIFGLLALEAMLRQDVSLCCAWVCAAFSASFENRPLADLEVVYRDADLRFVDVYL